MTTNEVEIRSAFLFSVNNQQEEKNEIRTQQQKPFLC